MQLSKSVTYIKSCKWQTIFKVPNCGEYFPYLLWFYQYMRIFFTGECRYKIYEQTSIRGNNIFTKTAITWQHCHDLCETVTEITCRSFEYNPVSQYCQLSDTNRWREKNQFAYYVKSWDYYHKTCVTGKTIIVALDYFFLSISASDEITVCDISWL